jgi:hypothetical protein
MKTLLALFALLLLPIGARAQTDGQRLSEAQYALSQNNCSAASSALDGVSDEFAKNPVWVYTAAKATECLKLYDRALMFYQQYDQLVPGQPEITKKIGEMLYLQKQQALANTASQEQKKLADQQKLLHEQQQADQAKVAAQKQSVIAAQKTLQSGLNSYGDFTYSHQGHGFRYTLTATVSNCRLRTQESIAVNEELFSYTKTENENTPLGEVNIDSIEAGEDDKGTIEGSYLEFSLAGDAEHISHVDHTTSSVSSFNDDNSTHVSSARYFSDTDSNRDAVLEKFKAAVQACQPAETP